MDVHPTKNGINRYWSIPILWYSTPHFGILNFPTFLSSMDFLRIFLEMFSDFWMISSRKNDNFGVLGSLGVCSTFLIFLMITSWFVGHTQLYQLARSELDSFDLFDSVDFIYINSCGRSAWIINELYNLTCIGLSLVDKIHSCLIIIVIIDVMGSDVLWLPERIFVDRMIFDLTSYNDSSRVIT